MSSDLLGLYRKKRALLEDAKTRVRITAALYSVQSVKLVRKRAVELYDLKSDHKEEHNLADERGPRRC